VASGMRLSTMNGMNKASRQVAGALAVALACSLAACGSAGGSGSSGVCGQASQVNALAVQHAGQGPLARKHGQGFEFPAKKITDPAAARSVAEAICGLPPMTTRAIVCPVELFATYVLVFSVGGEKLAPVRADPYGCEQVQWAGQDRTAARSPGLWRTLSEAEHG
jgi:hypothetical protein